MICSASLSCGPQSHFSEPNTSPVRHSLCSRTSGGLPPNAPTTSATCSCPSSRRAEGDDLRRRHVVERELGAGDDLDRRLRPLAHDLVQRDARRRHRAGSSSHSAGSKPAERARTSAARARLDAIAARPDEAGRSGRGRDRGRDRRSRARSRRRATARARSAPALPGSAASRSLASFSAAARSPLISSRARCSGSRRSSSSWRRGLDRDNRDRLRRRRSAPAGRRAARDRRRTPRAAQTSISQISGTWSDGRSQLRHGSSTSCAFRWPASSGDAHIWSSRRPRSFLVQSGER